MPVETQQVLIELIADGTQLEKVLDMLERTGKIDPKQAQQFRQMTAEFNKVTEATRKAGGQAKTFKDTLETLDDTTKKVTQQFMSDFEAGVMDALEEAGVSVDEFIQRIKGGTPQAEKQFKTLKGELRALTDQIARAKANGADFGDEYERLVQKAGDLRDAVGDVNNEIKTAGSDTRSLDGLISVTTGVAGGFAAAQGAAALFGDESEEMQETLLRVNAAMSILQGLQSIQNVLQKDSAASMLVLNVQHKIRNAQISLENALTSKSIIVRFGAAAAQRVLNLAMAANPIGLVVVALSGLITLLATYGRSAAAAARQTTDLDVALNQGAEAFKARQEALQKSGQLTVENLKNQGAIASELARQEQSNADQSLQLLKERKAELESILKSSGEAEVKQREAVQAELRKISDEILNGTLELQQSEAEVNRLTREEALRSRVSTLEAQLELTRKGSAKELELKKGLIAAQAELEKNGEGLLQAERDAINARAIRQQREAQAAFNTIQIQDQIKLQENKLILAEEGSQEEFALRTRMIELQTKLELQDIDLSEKQKNAIVQKGLLERQKLARDFALRVRQEVLENAIAENNAALSALETGEEDKLLLREANVNLQAEIEVQAAKGNSLKIQAIYAEREAAIRQLRLDSLEKMAELELKDLSIDSGKERRKLDRIIGNEKLALSLRRESIRRVADLDLQAVDISEKLNEDEFKQKLITEEAYLRKKRELADRRAEIEEGANIKIQEQQKAHNEKLLENIFKAAALMGQTLEGERAHRRAARRAGGPEGSRGHNREGGHSAPEADRRGGEEDQGRAGAEGQGAGDIQRDHTGRAGGGGRAGEGRPRAGGHNRRAGGRADSDNSGEADT
jgi:hypothetical protein